MTAADLTIAYCDALHVPYADVGLCVVVAPFSWDDLYHLFFELDALIFDREGIGPYYG